jgi:hypothetical protein
MTVACSRSCLLAVTDRAGLLVRERGNRGGRAVSSGELQLVDDGVSGEGKGTNGFLSTSHIA